MAQRHLSKGALAAHLGVAASTVSRWKDAAPRAETVLKTARWLGVDANWLLTGQAQKKPESEEFPDDPFAEHAAKLNDFSIPFEKKSELHDVMCRMEAMETQMRLLTHAVTSLLTEARRGTNPPKKYENEY